jgi:hypothetical protein
MPNILNASFLKYGPVRGLEQVTIRQKFGNHTLAFLDYSFRKKTEYVMPSEQTPVAVRWGRSPLGVKTYYGYVNHYETSNDKHTRLVATGTSTVLNSANPTNWTGFTRSGVAREIAKRHKLRSIVHEHSDVMENWTNGNQSDFKALQVLAKEAGYRVWVDGSTLYFLDPRRLLTSAQTMHIPTFGRDKIRSSKVTGGSNAPRESGPARRRVLHGLDHATNEFFTATGGNPDLPVETLGAPVGTYAEANRTVSDAADHDYYYLDLVVTGSADVYPGGLIRIQEGHVSRDLGGVWLVAEAEHTVSNKDFTTKLVATRGNKGWPELVPSSMVQGVQERAGAIVRDGRFWEAELQEHVNV